MVVVVVVSFAAAPFSVRILHDDYFDGGGGGGLCGGGSGGNAFNKINSVCFCGKCRAVGDSTEQFYE